MNSQEDQTLYFQTMLSGYYDTWLMNTSMPSGEGRSQHPSNLYFVSPLLAKRFTFETISVTLYHDEVLEKRGTYILDACMHYKLLRQNN